MSWFWATAPFAAVALGTVLALLGLRHLLRHRAAKGLAFIVVGAVLAVAALPFGVIALNTRGFAPLSAEADVANVAVTSLNAPKHLYRLTIQRLDAPGVIQTCDIEGDEWEASVSVQKWKPWTRVFGVDMSYTLDRVNGRYSRVDHAAAKLPAACALRDPVPAIDKYVPRAWLSSLLNGAYADRPALASTIAKPNADGAVYKLTMTPSGLKARPVNAAANIAASSLKRHRRPR
jgi:hypothetical protein